jgi:hypothetical protein
MTTTECAGRIGTDGRCLACREVVFPHVWDRVQRRRLKPAARNGLLPAGIRRKAAA